MDCRMGRGIYLRANGEINCYCSTGEQVSLARLPLSGTDFDFVRDYYEKGRFDHIRRSLAEDRLPFPDICLKCNYLAPFGRYDPDLAAREIEWAHLESAAVCNLRCPFCVHGIPEDQRTYQRSGPSLLPVELYDKTMTDIARAGLNIKWMYFSGRGEPGMHPRIWDMVATAKQLFHTNFLVNTNGNIRYHNGIVDSGLDKIKIAFDSQDQGLYEKYRVNGKVKNILELTRAIVDRKIKTKAPGPQVIWQKVMFNFNDSDRDLLEYQQLAADHGVDLIKLVFTWTDRFSTRRPDDLPITFKNVEILDTYDRDNMTAAQLEEALDALQAAPDIPRAVHFISRILHWLELGQENRDQYDQFATLALFDEKITVNRRHSPDLPAFLAALALGLEILGREYQRRGMTSEAEPYLDWARKMQP